MVLRAQQVGHADRRRLLADREMGRPAVIVGDAPVRALELDLVEGVLELPDQAHVPEDVEQIFRREVR
jgi:hypothetical protein